MNTPPNPATVPLAIVGIGCLFPKSDGAGHFWANVKNAADCITDVPATHWNPDEFFDADPKKPDMTYARRGGFLNVVDFNPLEFGIAPRDIEATDTTQLLGLVAAKQALNDAKVDFAKTDRSKVSVILGVTGTLELVIPLGARLGHPKWRRALKESGVPDDVAEDVVARISESYVPWQENSFPGLLGNVVAGRIANRLDLHGTNCVVDAACASSLSAVHLASLELATGKSDVVVTGGADTFNDIFMFMCFSKTPALSPTGNSKPFDANGDGTILGEGIGVVVLKRLADAEREGDRIYAVLRGIGTSSDGKGNAIYAPSADGQKRCLIDAYTRAGVSPETIELVEAHGTGTKVGDATEATALSEVFGPSAKLGSARCAIGSVKSQIGHTKAAAGAASLIKVALSLYNKVLPPTIKVTQPVEPLAGADSVFYVNGTMRPWLPRAEHPRRAGLSAFGFGGSNFHAVLEEHQPKKALPDWDGRVEILALSSDTVAGLQTELQKVEAVWVNFARASELSRTQFQASAPIRLILVADRDSTDLSKLLEKTREQLSAYPDVTSWQLSEGAFFGRGTAPGKLAVLFPGQGSQTVGMLRDLACLFPEFLDTLSAANADFAENQADSRRLTDFIYPPTRYGPTVEKDQERDLRATSVAQPALGAVSFGAWLVLAHRFGLRADAFAGHSYGELPALAAAGRLGMAELFRLSRVRGQLMGQMRMGDAGGMIAVLAPLTEIETVLKDEKLQLVVANKNAPKQTVLSGSNAEIDRASELFQARKMRSTKLPVAAAFHSDFVSDAAEPFRQVLNNVAFPAGSVPVYSNTIASVYPEDPQAARDLLGYQLAKSVAFVDQIRAMAEAGVRTFLEVGPGAVLTRLTEAILADAAVPDFAAISLDSSAGKKSGTLNLAFSLARLAARGHTVDLANWERGSLCRPPALPTKLTMTVPVCGANSMLPRPPRPPRLARAETVAPKLPGSLAGNRPMNALPSSEIAQALQLTQQTLAALQRMQEETAQLHRQFLERQEQAQRTLHSLISQQQALLFPGATPVAPAISPAPIVQPVPPAPSPLPVPPPPVVVPPTRPSPNLETQRIVAPSPRTVAAPAPRLIPPVAPIPTPSSSLPSEQISTVLIGVVSEKTGYPAEMLTLEMSLDSDLGVDSIKRVEILSALQDKLPLAPVVKPEHLGTLHTLRDVALFLSGSSNHSSGTAPAPLPAPVPAPARAGFPAAESVFPGLSANEPPRTIATPITIETVFGTSLKNQDIAAVLIGVVSEKTGYPAEMLTLEMSLDSDLGVDSIKRVEILSALQDKLPLAPVVKPEHLGTLHTLRDVALFLSGSSNLGKAPQSAIQAPPTPTRTPTPDVIELKKLDLGVASNPTSQSEMVPKTEPVSAIRMPDVTPSVLSSKPPTLPLGTKLSAENDHSISGTASRTSGSPLVMDRIDRSILQAVDLDLTAPRARLALPHDGEVWVVTADEPLAAELVKHFQNQRLKPRLFSWVDPDLANIDDLPNPVALVLVSPPGPQTEVPVNQLGFRWMQQAGIKLRQAGRLSPVVIATVARLDGTFGLTDLVANANPISGGLSGLVKTARFEWSDVVCKAIDCAPGFIDQDPAGAAAALVEETLTLGPLEVGVTVQARCTPELVRTVRKQPTNSIPLGAKDVVLITGGARGVTAEVAAALAETFRSTIVMIGRTPISTTPEPNWLVAATDEAAMKKAIAENLGATATPKQVGETYQRYAAQREIRQTMARIEQCGAKVGYFAADVTDSRQMADIFHQIHVRYGSITALVHGAGVLADKRIEDLTLEQFDRVYRTKVVGLQNILELLGGEELKAIMLFSSTTARFGRTGQVAYAVANEVLNKYAQVESRLRLATRVVAINWGPWDGGMVTPGLRKVFESEGVGLIPLADGGVFAIQELNMGGRAAEVVAMGKVRPAPKSDSTAAPGAAINRTAAPAFPASAPLVPPTNPPTSELNFVFERTVDLETHPVMRSHVIDGRAVLPMALHMEWLAHAALHGNPGLLFHGFNEMRVTNGVMIEEGHPSTVRAMAGRATKVDKMFHVPVELRGKRRDGRDVIHSKAEVILAATLPKAPFAQTAPELQPYPHPLDEIYRYFLFHGPDLHGIEKADGVSEVAFVGSVFPAPTPAEWFREPLRTAWVTDPLVLDASFQMMILWSYTQHGSGSLPCFAGRFRQYRRMFPNAPIRVVIRITRDNGSFARADIDYLDAADGTVIAQIQDYECVIDPQLNQAFRRNQLAQRQKLST